jgi:hypothetical protein
MLPQEAFKVGFMLRCADEGLSPAEAQERIQKAAACMEKQSIQALTSGLQGLGDLGLAGAIGAPVGLGVLGGYLLNKARESEVDEDDVRRDELIQELKHWTRRAKEQQKAKLLRLA